MATFPARTLFCYNRARQTIPPVPNAAGGEWRATLHLRSLSRTSRLMRIALGPGVFCAVSQLLTCVGVAGPEPDEDNLLWRKSIGYPRAGRHARHRRNRT